MNLLKRTLYNLFNMPQHTRNVTISIIEHSYREYSIHIQPTAHESHEYQHTSIPYIEITEEKAQQLAVMLRLEIQQL